MHYEENLIASCHLSLIPFNYIRCVDIYAYKWLISRVDEKELI